MDATRDMMDKLPGAEEQSIGAILVETGRLRPEEAQAVLNAQKTRGGSFGANALHLGLVTRADIDFALARQFDYPYLPGAGGIVDPSVVAACQPFSAAAEHLRALRTQLALRWFNARVGRKTLAVTGVGRGEGRSFVAANLAVLFAQMGARTLLLDADLRGATQHRLFHIDNRVGLSSVLVGRAGSESIVRIGALRNLYILPAGPPPPNPQELLGRSLFVRQLRTLESLFDVVLADTTAAEVAADGQIAAAASGSALLVVRQDATDLDRLRALRATLDLTGSQVLGAVVNRL